MNILWPVNTTVATKHQLPRPHIPSAPQCPGSSAPSLHYSYRPNRVLTFQHGPALTEMVAESLGHSTVWSSLQVKRKPGLRESRQRPGRASLRHRQLKLAKSSQCCPTSSKALWDRQGCPPVLPAHQYPARPLAQGEHTHIRPSAAFSTVG